jgi:hypothetical protein
MKSWIRIVKRPMSPSCYFIVFGIISLIAACLASPAYAQPAEPKVVYVLFDLSQSTGATTSRTFYNQKFAMVLDSLKDGERIAAGVIQDRALSQRYAVNDKLPVFSSFTDNRLIFQKKLDLQKKKIRDDVETMLRNGNSGKSEIMNALFSAEQFFNSYKENNRKILVILSDMVEYSEGFNFIKTPPADDKAIEKIVSDLKKKNRLPLLGGAKVYVIGADAVKSSDIVKIKKFWLRYFRECQADLDPNNYGADIARFEE